MKEIYKDENCSFEERAKNLVDLMTVEECAEQMIFSSLENKKLGIKKYNWWNEALHGVARSGMATVFPQAIAMAASFDSELVNKVADAISTEGRAKYNLYQKYEDYGIYKGITFWSPNINIFRDPRWGRGQETYGEDPYLTAEMGVAFVKGLQGNDDKYLKTAACAKHFAVHSGPEKIRHQFNAEASPKDMAETYLPAFKKLVDAGVEGVMGAYNRTNGEPCCGSKTLMVDLLRNKWGFKGYYTSDCWAISDFYMFHHITEGPVDSAALALKNGCDMNCGTVYEHIMEAYETGKVSEKDIRDCCYRVIKTRMRLGMFDKETPFDNIDYSVVECEEHKKLNLHIAEKSMVLLKNNGILPLNKEKIKNIAVIGPNADSLTALLGNYHGRPSEYYTVLSAIKESLPHAKVTYTIGSHLYEDILEDTSYVGDGLAEAKILAHEADVVILAVGMDETIEGEEIKGKEGFTGDKRDLLLPPCQRRLIETLCNRKTPVILVNMTGSAFDFEKGCDADAIIQAWYPGAMGGKAISNLIFGEYSPSGKLPVTFYKNTNTLPDYSDYSMDNRTYKFFKEEPLYPFGYGLSYSKFQYKDLVAEKKDFNPGENLKFKVTVKNIGNYDSDETVEIYLKDLKSTVRVPVHKLCGIKKIFLKKGEEKTIEFEIAGEDFAIINDNGEPVYEKGEFTVFAGNCQPDEYSCKLSNSTPASLNINMI